MKQPLEEYPAVELTDELLELHYFLLKMEKIDFEKWLDETQDNVRCADSGKREG